MDGLTDLEERLYRYAYAKNLEFEYKGDLPDGCRVWELSTKDGRPKIQLCIKKDGSINSGYGEDYRELTVEEVEEIISSQSKTDT